MQAAREYYGQLFTRESNSTPMLYELLFGIAHHIIERAHPRSEPDLVPHKMSDFYRAVGGNYDPLFVDTSHSALSFIYSSLGCAHKLLPTDNDFSPPSIPALLPRGFVRWQTIQLLLDPNEHVPYLQETVRKYDIKNMLTGEIFPKILPRDCFPARADLRMLEWHNGVCETLRNASQARNGY
ncbi:MAG: hypothetical protein M1829_002732 [Trizodia sp. TS-e1964]|nr:MAG: hypothetical protein M1829_002732 [Trizodia sp. TS-e1964]